MEPLSRASASHLAAVSDDVTQLRVPLLCCRCARTDGKAARFPPRKWRCFGPRSTAAHARFAPWLAVGRFGDRYSEGVSRREQSVSEGAATRLRDLTFGSKTSLGPPSVSCRRRAGSRVAGLSTALALSALPAQRVRASVSAYPAAKPVLQRGLPASSAAVAATSGESALA